MNFERRNLIAKAGRFTRAGLALAMISLGSSGTLSQSALAAPAPKVAICHLTTSLTNPYVLIEVAQSGLADHQSHGDVIPAPPDGCADKCPNIAGVQVLVPAGLVKDASGNCVPKDVCPNLPGDQPTVPAGFHLDLQGNCVPNDVCPNIAGDQPTGPVGLLIDTQGNCVPIPQPCINATLSGGQGITVTNHELGQTGGTFQFEYNTLIQPDRITIRYEGIVIFDVGPIGTGGTVSTMVNYGPGTSTQIEITVDGLQAGTVWNYVVHCPSV